MEAAKRSYARALKGSKKTNEDRAKHRARAKSALSRYTKRNPNTKKAPAPPVNHMDKFTLGLILNGLRDRKRERAGEAAYPAHHIPKRAPIRNTTVAKERAQRVANQMTRRLAKRTPSGVPSRAEERRSFRISQRRAIKNAKRASESAAGRHKSHAAKKRAEHMSAVPEETHSGSHSNDFFDKT
jgi:hypothetical protein